MSFWFNIFYLDKMVAKIPWALELYASALLKMPRKFEFHLKILQQSVETYLAEIMICYTMEFRPMDCPSHHKYYNNDIKDKTMILVPDNVPENRIVWEDPNES